MSRSTFAELCSCISTCGVVVLGISSAAACWLAAQKEAVLILQHHLEGLRGEWEKAANSFNNK